MSTKSKTQKKGPAKKKKTARSRAKILPILTPVCALCGDSAHQGDSEESLESLAALNPEAAVFFDRDLADLADVAGLCGPRFRQSAVGLCANYGSPAGRRYVVYRWDTDDQHWVQYVDAARGVDARTRNLVP